MLIRPVHAVPSLSECHSMIRASPLGVLTTAIRSHDSDGFPFLQASHIPWVLDPPDEEEGEGDLGTLRGHIARTNPQAKAMVASLEKGGEEKVELDEEVLVLFTAPNHGYVTPKFFTETKPQTGKVVPTWVYDAVQVYGRLTLYHAQDDRTNTFLSQQIHDLSTQGEASMGFVNTSSQKNAWEVSDAPAPYIKQLKRVIVGMEVKVTRIEGKSKMMQEERKGDRMGVAGGFRRMGGEKGEALARRVEERSEQRERAREA
ncbi:hypothetical protein JCM8547_004061 [Rhodosporidiobolus lusitaniae]